MKKPSLLVASSNAGKLREFRRLLGGQLECLSPVDQPFPVPDVVEDGETYYENALKKAIAYHKAYRCPVLSDDSGLEVEALGGAPGVFSARFGGERLSWMERWRHLHEQLRASAEPWNARFRAVLCYYDGKNVPVFFEGFTEGHVLKEAKGTEGFGYDPIFFSTALRKSFGEASNEEKERASHRAAASARFLQWYGATQRG